MTTIKEWTEDYDNGRYTEIKVYQEDSKYYIRFGWFKRFDNSGTEETYECQLIPGETINDYINGVKRG